MTEEDEKRVFRRVELDVKVVTSTDQPIVVTGHTIDVSLNGISVRCASPLDVGVACKILLYLEDGESIDAEGKVLRQHDEGMVLQFTNLPPRHFVALRRYTNPKSPVPLTGQKYSAGK